MRKLLLVLVVSACAVAGYCQDNLADWQTAAPWSEGTIVDNDGKEIKGLLKYNDLDGLLLFRNDETEKTFTARNIFSFSFTDASRDILRRFYSLEYEDPVNNAKRPLFFEVLNEFKQFSILIKKDPVVFNQQDGSAGNSNNSMKDANGVIRAQQTETIYFMSQQGVIEPYLELEVTQTNGLFNERVRNKRKVVDDDLPKKYFGEKNYAKILSFAKENKLRLSRKEDFLRVIDYYREIVSKK